MASSFSIWIIFFTIDFSDQCSNKLNWKCFSIIVHVLNKLIFSLVQMISVPPTNFFSFFSDDCLSVRAFMRSQFVNLSSGRLTDRRHNHTSTTIISAVFFLSCLHTTNTHRLLSVWSNIHCWTMAKRKRQKLKMMKRTILFEQFTLQSCLLLFDAFLTQTPKITRIPHTIDIDHVKVQHFKSFSHSQNHETLMKIIWSYLSS